MSSISKILSLLFFAHLAFSQTEYITVPDNFELSGIPNLPIGRIDEVQNYNNSRHAYFVGWHPIRKEMLVSTRFGNSYQIHSVKMPMGDRKQITFFNEPVNQGTYNPIHGDYFLFYKDIGGNEFLQIYKFDTKSKKIDLLTDGKRSQNSGIRWNTKGDKIAYNSTKRNGKDRDIYVMDPLDKHSDKRVLENIGGGWYIFNWSSDDSQLLVGEFLSLNESSLYTVSLTDGLKKKILPLQNEKANFEGIAFSKNNKGIFLLTNKDSEFDRLAYLDLLTNKLTYLTQAIPWSVEDGTLSKDGLHLAFITNEDGLSKIYLLSTSTFEYTEVPNLPTGLINKLIWTPDSKSIGFSLEKYNSPSNVFEYNIETKELIKWTDTETGGIDISALPEPQLIYWKSFDNKVISGYLYKAPDKFAGKRPVYISIHGGPEDQYRPYYLGLASYYVNELGISVIYPNVRGSTGYGKTFANLDNGLKRMESVKDIGSLLDWISTQAEMDKEKIMVSGGSYGGFMSLAVSYTYPDKIRCSVDVVGISNFNTFLKNTEAYRRDMRRAEYGDERDSTMAKFFEDIAPLNHVEKIKHPLLIVQGGNDPRVPYTEAVQMKNKLQQKGNTVWFLMAKDEGHGFQKKNNIDFQFYTMVEFMKSYLLN